MAGKVNSLAMSPVAAAHCLVAVASEQPHVRLCDPATQGLSHTLVGHR